MIEQGEVGSGEWAVVCSGIAVKSRGLRGLQCHRSQVQGTPWFVASPPSCTMGALPAHAAASDSDDDHGGLMGDITELYRNRRENGKGKGEGKGEGKGKGKGRGKVATTLMLADPTRIAPYRGIASADPVATTPSGEGAGSGTDPVATTPSGEGTGSGAEAIAVVHDIDDDHPNPIKIVVLMTLPNAPREEFDHFQNVFLRVAGEISVRDLKNFLHGTFSIRRSFQLFYVFAGETLLTDGETLNWGDDGVMHILRQRFDSNTDPVATAPSGEGTGSGTDPVATAPSGEGAGSGTVFANFLLDLRDERSKEPDAVQMIGIVWSEVREIIDYHEVPQSLKEDVARVLQQYQGSAEVALSRVLDKISDALDMDASTPDEFKVLSICAFAMWFVQNFGEPPSPARSYYGVSAA